MKKTILRTAYRMSRDALLGLLMCCLLAPLVMAEHSSAQSIEDVFVEIAAENNSVESVFSGIESETSFSFLYSKYRIEAMPYRVSFTDKRRSVADILRLVARETGLKFRQINKTITVNVSDFKTVGKDDPVAETVEGTVYDANTQESLPGVNIMVKGTTTGTSTDSEGAFELTVESLQDTLIATFVGYKTKVIPINEREKINIEMQQEAITGEEMVVVGYGTQKEENLVGSVSEMEVEDIATRPSADIASSLQGAIPGLNVRNAGGGDPSKTASINIRGFNSINGGSPLVLVDGIEEDLANVNPNDIESVTVLKDAEAAAIYGARGSFGVILITTKTGTEGEFEVEYSNNTGFTTNTTRTDFVTNPATYARWADEAIGSYHSGCYVCYEGEDWDIAEQVGKGEIEPYYEEQPDGTYKFYGKTDYYDLLFKKRRPHVMHNISVSGGSDKINGFISGRIYQRDKVQNIQDSKLKRYNLQVSLNITPYDWLKLSAISKFSSRFNEEFAGTKNGWGGTFGVSKWRDAFPNYPAFIDGYGVSIGRTRNGYVGRMGALKEGAAHRRWKYEKQTNTLKAEVNPVQGLELKMDYSYSIDRNDRTYTYTPFSYLSGNELELIEGAGLNRHNEWRWKDYYQALNMYGTYTQDIADKHNFKLMLGYNQEVFDRDRVGARIEDLLTRDKANISFGTEMLDMSGSTLDWALQGYFGRFNYNYDGKYLLEVNTRYDGSSRFPKDNRWGLFPSVGIGWQVDNEKFWTSAVDNVISSLKLRASYGKLGNQSVGVNTFRELIGMGRKSWLVDGQEVNYARAPEPLPANIAWEKITSTNIGVDMGFLEDKLSASVDLYERNTSDMYLPGRPLPAVFGASEPRRNYASMRNRGFELTVGYNDQFDVMGSELSFNIQANVSNNKAVITKFDNPNGLLSTFWEGQEVGEIWGYRIDGQFQSNEAAAAFENKFGRDNLVEVYRGILDYGSNSDWNYLKGGDLKYVDVNGDGMINNGANTLEDRGDLVPIGNAMPQFPFGFNINADWKYFDLSVIGQGVAKQHWYPSGPLYWATFHRPYVSFIRKDLLDKVWDPKHPNDPNRIYPQRQRAYNALSSGRMSANLNDHYLTNIGYLRIKNLTLGYTLPLSLTQKINVKRLRIFFSGENLFTWTFGGLTDYLDPEAVGAHVSYSNPNGVSAKPATNTQLYPMGKTYSAGVQISL
ncbi:SusC/RagA family TonB-linked outer membrane protein [Fodinibius salsisoli]|uniref:TonB-dependent receptor n=1 Tax=Fodinibius salsisoli TaxID=2820877 RepID=A0ABT3PP99_9BACT|nr:TonB-dependent receptor [Fodinibius salsisoli]MCW9707683.1 TonB-dependent receptor [Fodinibius salsisoli]